MRARERMEKTYKESFRSLPAQGAEWIEIQSRETFGEQVHFLLDYYHASEYLADASETCRPSGTCLRPRSERPGARRPALLGQQAQSTRLPSGLAMARVRG